MDLAIEIGDLDDDGRMREEREGWREIRCLTSSTIVDGGEVGRPDLGRRPVGAGLWRDWGGGGADGQGSSAKVASLLIAGVAKGAPSALGEFF
ncbi:hypothetical protein TIFTF001_023766 [Ficus carica]|uniref:Uncharacterized protein n=1 Tax=Ficus carica TaxID=3494 RepID=A0AA88AK69_FICCA|nr:hypothetical protein TIFTF001_023766 [Ficus carica]